jgi:stage IV sporulation protein B
MMNGKNNNLKIKLYTLLFAIILVISSFVPVYAATAATNSEVILGGCLFGVKMQTNGVVIIGINKIEGVSPAIGAGIKQGDIIKMINGKGIASSDDVLKMIAGSKGNSLNITVQRGNENKTLTLTPKLDSDNKYRAGILIRDSAAGIGTVTYIDSKTNEFAGLGHGICDSDTASLLPLSRGIVTEVDLIEVVKGRCGTPGEIKGAFKGSKIGSLTKNTSNGVHGIYSSLPNGIGQKIKLADIAKLKTVKQRLDAPYRER